MKAAFNQWYNFLIFKIYPTEIIVGIANSLLMTLKIPFMKKKLIKKVVRWSAITFLILTIILIVHIYLVTKPGVDASTRIMARIDVNQPISQVEANNITAWLYQQNGVDHVMCNPQSAIAIFTYSPLKANANNIALSFRSALDYPDSRRYIPSEKEMQSSCPVASSSFLYKAAVAIKKIF